MPLHQHEHRNVGYFTQKLRANPGLSRPEWLGELGIEEASHEWRAACRAYDQARLALGLRSARAIQAENSPFENFKPRIAGFHASPRKQAS
jgi:hypothetical protein